MILFLKELTVYWGYVKSITMWWRKCEKKTNKGVPSSSWGKCCQIGFHRGASIQTECRRLNENALGRFINQRVSKRHIQPWYFKWRYYIQQWGRGQRTDKEVGKVGDYYLSIGPKGQEGSRVLGAQWEPKLQKRHCLVDAVVVETPGYFQRYSA